MGIMSALRLSKRWAPTTAKKQLSLSSPLLGKRCPSFHSIPRTIPAATKIGIAGFHVSSTHRVALMPESGKPKPPDIEEPESPPVTELTESDFHSKADHYLEALMTRLEELAETKEGVEVDYSVSDGPSFRIPDLYHTAVLARASPSPSLTPQIVPTSLPLVLGHHR